MVSGIRFGVEGSRAYVKGVVNASADVLLVEDDGGVLLELEDQLVCHLIQKLNVRESESESE